jgi:hypothetical protein
MDLQKADDRVLESEPIEVYRWRTDREAALI